MSGDEAASERIVVGRYTLFGPIAAGGMGTVHFGRLVGTAGFSRTVAVKRMHPHLAARSEFVAAFLDEARLAARVCHPNVVQVLDVVSEGRDVLLVMEYVRGETLARLVRLAAEQGEPIPGAIASAIVCGLLHGLHAAHEAADEEGRALEIVHRDISPHNVMVATDGVARVLDFGVAKAASRLQTTADGRVKGTVAYMAPEQLMSQSVTRRTDVFAAGVVLWEALAGRRRYDADAPAGLLREILEGPLDPPSRYAAVDRALDGVVMRALERDARKRFATAREFALALELAGPSAPAWQVGEWVERLASSALSERARLVNSIETDGSGARTVRERASEVTVTGTDSEVSELVRSPGGAQREPGRRSSLRLFAVIAPAALLGTALAVYLARGATDGTPVTRTATRAEPVAASASVSTSAAASAPAGASASAPPAPSGTAPAAPGRFPLAKWTPPAAPVTTPPPATTSAAKPASCDPPFTWVGDIKQIKPGCVR